MKQLLFFVMMFFLGNVFSQESILLNTPSDGDTIYTHHPLLTWSIWGGLPIDNEREYYQITIVQLQANQDAASGVMVNTPLVRMDHLTQNQLFYPYDAPELQDGGHYGWQVQKIMNNAVVYSSEAFEFILGIPPVETPVYYKMKLVQDGAVYATQNGSLYFVFEENYSLQDLHFKLYNKDHIKLNKNILYNAEDGVLAQEINVKKTGTNFYRLMIGSNLEPGTYYLEVLNSKKQRYFLKFNLL